MICEKVEENAVDSSVYVVSKKDDSSILSSTEMGSVFTQLKEGPNPQVTGKEPLVSVKLFKMGSA